MRCPNCSTLNSFGTLDTRATENDVIRRRKCKKCGYVFWTQELVFSVTMDKPKPIQQENKFTPVKQKIKPKPKQTPTLKLAPKKPKHRRQTSISNEIDSIFQEIEQHKTTYDERQTINDLNINSNK